MDGQGPTVGIGLLILLIAALVLSGLSAAQVLVSFPTQDGGIVYADLYGKGDHGVVLAHGGRFDKESWEQQARTLTQAGFRVLAAVRYLRESGSRTVSVVGGSIGGWAAHAQHIFATDRGKQLMQEILRFLSEK